MKLSRGSQVSVVLALFAAGAFFAFRSGSGDDLSSSYIGCRILAAGETRHLYSHSAVSFDQVDDPLWTRIAAQSRFASTAILHPYVQTPLWGYALEPLCTGVDYPAFHAIFLALELLCFSALLWLISRFWAPRLFHPGWIALVCAVFYASVPVRYGLDLAQTHILFILAALAALLCARRYPVVAGALLALAAAIKITPAYLVIYWLLTRRYRAAASFAGCSAALAGITVAATGWALFRLYLQTLAQTSNVLLVAYNNQSFPAWIMSHAYPAAELTLWRPHPLPAALKLATTLLALSCAAVGGMLDRNARNAPPYGAIFVLLGATLFTPIAWTHYFFLLAAPAMLLLDAYLRRRSVTLLSIVVLLCALSLTPHRTLHYSFRSRFYAGILSLAGLALARRREPYGSASPLRVP